MEGFRNTSHKHLVLTEASPRGGPTAPVLPTRPRLVQHLLEEQSVRSPRAPAVLYEDAYLTYEDLNAKANTLGRYLVNRGLRRDEPVGVCVGRSLDLIVSVLGVLKAGGAYLPLDPNYPPERLRYMLDDACPRIVLIQEELRAALPETDAAVVSVDHTLKRLGGYVADNLPAQELGLTADSLAYVIYTSGSTGRPKGTAMPHRSLVNLIEWHRTIFQGDLSQRVLQFAALSFDVAFQEIFTTLCTGGTLVLLDEWVRRDMRALRDLIGQQSIHRLFLPPMVLQSLAEHCNNTRQIPTTLREVITAGEQLRISADISRLFRAMPECRLHNHYGPTETHVVTALTLSGDCGSWPALPSIGRPIQNAAIYLLDEHQQPVPPNAAGEIYIGGVPVARGYFGKPELTKSRFAPDPFDASGKGSMYRTGDIGRWLSDGTLQYLGRNDDQVKVRGFRIELGEIEARLTAHEHVREAAVVLREDAPGDKRLVAYATLRAAAPVTVEGLRAHLSVHLPEHMVPSAFVFLQSFPLTPNGKLDRRSLPPPDASAYVHRAYEPPKGEMEGMLAAIWRDLLRVERVGRHDAFFDLGGHSILIVQMVERLRQAGLTLEGRQVFENPTLEDLSKLVVKGVTTDIEVPSNRIPLESDSITPDMLPLVQLEPHQLEIVVASTQGGARNVQDIYPLAPLQAGILFHHLLDSSGGDPYVLPTLLRLASRERLEQFIEGLQKVIDRHDILRTAVLWEELPWPVQVVCRKATLPVHEVRLQPGQPALDQLMALMTPERQRMDLRRAPLLRALTACDPSGDEQFLLLQMHHFVGDHESIDIALAEVKAYLEGRGDQLTQPVPYRDHVAHTLVWSQLDSGEAYFRDKLRGIDEPTAPFGLLDVHRSAASLREASHVVEYGLALKIRMQARLHGVSSATFFHACWALVVAHTSGRDDIVFGTLLTGRMAGNSGVQRSLGIYINTLPVRLDLQRIAAGDLLSQMHRELSELLGHEHASLATAQRCSDITGARPLFTSVLNYRHSAAEAGTTELAMAAGIEVISSREWTNYPVVLSVDDFGDRFRLVTQTDQSVVPQRVIGYVLTAVRSLLEALERSPGTPALTLDILPEEERMLVIQSFNPTCPHSSPEVGLIHQLFEQQSQLRPEACAVEFQGTIVSYAMLNQRANQLARYLRANGVCNHTRVAVCAERGPEMLVALLGILKAGGAYVPLDPASPPKRMHYILEDASPTLTLTHGNVRRSIPDSVPRVVAMEDISHQISTLPSANLDTRESGLKATDLAYIIYTSGSTGTPKGVMVEHWNVTRLFAATKTNFNFSERDVWALFHSFAFDFSVWEIFGALLHGGKLVIVPRDVTQSPEAFLQLLRATGVTVLNQTPSAFTQLIDAYRRSNTRDHTLRVVIFGGEALDARRLRPWLECNGAGPPQLVNMYGITETTVHVTYRRLTTDDIQGESGNMIGAALPDMAVYVLDRRGQPVPIGAAGEMYVGGAGVSRGYLNRPDLTRERFVPDPFAEVAGARMYKSGDLARWRDHGELEYLGRNDDQVKIRGFRIELGEIEAQLARHFAIKQAVVVVVDHVSGVKQLLAYVVPNNSPGEARVYDAKNLRAHLQSLLPDYMIPSAFITIDRIPLTVNGKLDRQALPRPERTSYAGDDYEAPVGEVEEIIAEIWRSVLGTDRVGRWDNFFQLGGHSLLATQVIVRIRAAFAVDLPIIALFQSPTLHGLASRTMELRRGSLDDALSAAGDDIDDLLATVAAIPESEVQDLTRALTKGESL